MVANLAYAPISTTNAAGSFNTTSVGLVQGMYYDDPAIRWALSGGLLASTETLPMWGGVGIYNNIPNAGTSPPSGTLGTIVGRATALTGSTALTGFSVFSQAYGMVNTPESPVPLAGSNMSVNYFLLGSGARIQVAADADLVSLNGGLITQDVSWDFTNQKLVPYSAPTFSAGSYTAGGSVTAQSYNSTTGVVTLTTTSAHGMAAGDIISVSGATGTGAYASINGTWTCGSGTTAETINYTIAPNLTMTLSGATLNSAKVTLTCSAATGLNPGDTVIVSGASGSGSYASINGTFYCAQGTTGVYITYIIANSLTMSISGATITTGGILPVKVLDINATNSMTVSYNLTTGLATWNRNGAAAVIQI